MKNTFKQFTVQKIAACFIYFRGSTSTFFSFSESLPHLQKSPFLWRTEYKSAVTTEMAPQSSNYTLAPS